MQTFLAAEFLQTARGKEADRILRSCVHCGFCTATCPTFILTGNELDSPRGRIYLIKEMLEGKKISKITQTHLDRCLTCQSCETTCPSNVQYHTLLDIGRAEMEKRTGRSLVATIRRYLMRRLLTSRFLFDSALKAGRLFRPVIPGSLKKFIPAKRHTSVWPGEARQRKMILLNGCVQNSLSPNTNAAAARVLEKLDIQAMTVAEEGCCGAVSYHLNAQAEGLQLARRNVDLFCEQLDNGIEAIISTASGCGNFIKGYPALFIDDDEYRHRSVRVLEQFKDISEVLQAEELGKLKSKHSSKLVFQCPCSLQHGQHLPGVVEDILAQMDFELTTVKDSHLCCGSAGTYSILQPGFARQLRQRKILELEAGNPDAIATANIGCQSYLGSVSSKEVKHWIEYVAEILDQAI